MLKTELVCYYKGVLSDQVVISPEGHLDTKHGQPRFGFILRVGFKLKFDWSAQVLTLWIPPNYICDAKVAASYRWHLPFIRSREDFDGLAAFVGEINWLRVRSVDVDGSQWVAEFVDAVFLRPNPA